MNSGYSRPQIRDLVESGLKGVVRKERRKLTRETRYRMGCETIEEREKKKLLESTSWYRDKLKEDTDDAVDKGDLSQKDAIKMRNYKNKRKSLKSKS